MAFLVALFSLSQGAVAQYKDSAGIMVPVLGPNDTIPVPAMVLQRELIPGGNMEWFWVSAPYPKHLLRKRQEWTRLRNAIYVTYPYARRAGLIMSDMNRRLATMTDKDERKKYIKSREKELKKEFSDPLQDLSVYQGKVLMKLINRQTGNNCYDIIKEYKGGITARCWQTVAFFFNSNLKQPYNAEGSELEMEKIVLEVERMYGYTGRPAASFNR
ncbi:MAG: DUF4294 domain-containing protein [Candidatus Pseudobacter hemicellulosilyticus]|uniref:DUF4294 domain-containing protein n=1 Tax=Candidatus Pseudobacter hemicellulosilyticus TaxID=3121375 RepID=A0AAJ6BH44_9BACT|nr:MAG: DUF4294 domain-containing protein [Pseudobacter sp.]